MSKTENTLRALVVDDEKAIRRFLKATLESHGYIVFEAAEGREALEMAVSCHPDVILLDLGLPDIEGLQVTREIRKRSQTPIIILSVRDQEADKIAALDAGADDYLTKPFGAGELLARLRAVLRRLLPQEEDPVFKTGKLSVDFSTRNVRLKDQPVKLTPTEYDVLKVLVLKAGKVVTHHQLLQEVWNKTEDLEGVAHLLRVTISNLRGKLEPDPDRPTYILTEPGIGYRLRSDS
jgi:two-component system KDP operon response regulator KdpE